MTPDGLRDRMPASASGHGGPSWPSALRALREARGVTQEGWAAQLGVSRRTVQRWERGLAAPDATAEAAILAYCVERGLCRRYDEGPLAGVTVTPEWLRDVLAGARVGSMSPDSAPASAPARAPDGGFRLDLPSPLTSFVGRERELAHVAELLGTARLVTLSGPGGVGKTRLALAVAHISHARARDGVIFVDLAPLSDPEFILAQLAAACGAVESSGRSILDGIVDALRDRRAWLLLDNCEHLLDACASLGEALLHRCPELTILATSRERLRIPGEIVFDVPSLATPAADEAGDSETLAGYAAVRLFADRAAAARPGFAMSSQNAPTVAAICRRLDGIPLAIELSAVWVRALSVEQIAARLDDRLHLLTLGSRTAAPRQQTLRATLDWSHDLLAPPEQALLRRLSVFAGGWTLEAAVAVCADPDVAERDILGRLQRLVDASLVVAEEYAGAMRYRLLETVREYASERLERAAESQVVRARHRDWYLALVEQAAAQLLGPNQAVWLDRLGTDQPNVRAALAWTLERGEGTVALRFAVALGWFWQMRAQLTEGRRWLNEVLATADADPTPKRGWALNWAGSLAREQGDFERAGALFDEGLATFQQLDHRELEHRRGVATVLLSLGMLAWYSGDSDRAVLLLEECLAAHLQLGWTRAIPDVLLNLGAALRQRGDTTRAAAVLEDCLAQYREQGNRWGITIALCNLGSLAIDQGDDGRAQILLEECLALARETGYRRETSIALTCLGLVASTQGDTSRASSFLDEGLTVAREIGSRREMAWALNALGDLARFEGDEARAARLFEECLAHYNALNDDVGRSYVLHNQALLARRRGEFQQAQALLSESLRVAHMAAMRPLQAVRLASLAGIIGEIGQWDLAARLLGAVADVLVEPDTCLPTAARAGVEEAMTSAHAALGGDSFAAHYAEGRALSLDEAVALALEQAKVGVAPVEDEQDAMS